VKPLTMHSDAEAELRSAATYNDMIWVAAGGTSKAAPGLLAEAKALGIRPRIPFSNCQRPPSWCTLHYKVAQALFHEKYTPGPRGAQFPLLQSCFPPGARIRSMGTVLELTPGDAIDPIAQLRGGDRQALAALFDRYRDRLRRMVELRIDARVRARLDASDVLQEAFLDVARDLDAYLADPKLPPLLWLRLHVGRRLTTLHRQHLGTKMRDAGMEISLYRDALPEASSAALASMLLGKHTSPTQAALRAERLLRVQEALNTLDPIDREVLALRHFEQLSRPETAEVLGISQEAGAKRYFRALKRLKDVLSAMPGGGEEL